MPGFFMKLTSMNEGIIGIVAGIFTSASMLPQVIKMLQDKKSSQVSIGMIVVLMIGVGLWVWYGIMKEDYPIIIANSFSLLVNIVMIVLRIRYGGNPGK